MFLKIQITILIPNYKLEFSDTASLSLEIIHNYSITISNSYYKKINSKFFKQFSFISYNPYAFQKLQSKLKEFKFCRRCIYLNYVIIYRIYNNHVEILDIYHSKSNYIK